MSSEPVVRRDSAVRICFMSAPDCPKHLSGTAMRRHSVADDGMMALSSCTEPPQPGPQAMARSTRAVGGCVTRIVSTSITSPLVSREKSNASRLSNCTPAMVELPAPSH